MGSNVYLGVSGVSSHDSAAALVIDSKVIAAVEEERFVREKHTGKFPFNSIEFCLKYAGISPRQVDCVTYCFNPTERFLPAFRFNLSTDRVRYILERGGSYNDLQKAFASAYRVEELFMVGLLKTQDYTEKNFKNARFVPVNHHNTHAASAFYLSPFEDASVLIADLMGEWDTTSWHEGLGNKLTKLKSQQYPDSLGMFYRTFTKFLGFQPNSDEFKVMGLSAYGNDTYLQFFKSMYTLNEDGSFTLNKELLLFCKGIFPEWDDKITSVIGNPRSHEEDISPSHRNIAYALQHSTEDILLHLVQNLVKRTGKRKLAMAGGVALNALANQKIRESGIIDDIFIQPASHDAGAALGAALYMYYQDNPNAVRNIPRDYYLGPKYSSQQILDEARKSDFRINQVDGGCDNVVQKLIDGKIVGLYQGRMEFGPRALGNRSILADPRRPEMKDTLNEKVKFREPFRPFAPVILGEDVADYFVNGKESPYMTQTFTATPLARKNIPAVVHEDGTSRIQTVTMDSNPVLYDIIRAFNSKTGVPVLVNTSLNINKEPIVCSPQDAIATLENSGIDALIMENIILEK